MTGKKVIRRYTLALYEVSVKPLRTEKVISDINIIKRSIEGSHDLRLFLKSPIIKSEKKSAVLHDIFKKKISVLTMNFLDMLINKQRENLLYDICTDFLELINEKKGILNAYIKVAIDITDKDKKTLANNLSRLTGKKVNAHYELDPSIKGGFVARISDTIVDASIKRQLELLFEHFKTGSIN